MRRAYGAVLVFAAIVVACGADEETRIDSAQSSETSIQDEAETDASAIDALPWVQRVALEQAMAERDPRYAPRVDQARPMLESASAGAAIFERDRTRLVIDGSHDATFGVVAIGREHRAETTAGAPEIDGALVRRTLGGSAVEWWRALPSGLEHGVTIDDAPPGAGALVVEIAVEGLTPQAISESAVALLDAERRPVARYAELLVLDADQTHIRATMSVRDDRIQIAIEDGDARYPLVVDPLVATQEASLLAATRATNDYHGYTVSLTADGSRAIVGAPYDDLSGATDAGSATVYVRSGSTWTREATITDATPAGGDLFGWSVAIAGDGTRAIIGVLRDDTAAGTDTGSARIYVRSGSTWTEEATLPTSGIAASDQLGYAVAMSSDGSRAIAGAALDDTATGTNAGSARIYVRSGTTWTQEALLSLAGGSNNDFFGAAVAMAGDASRVVVGAYWDDTAAGADAGSAYVYVRSGSAWSIEGTLLATGAAASDYFGQSVAIASDGTRVIVGAVGSETAHVYARAGSTWSHEATLTASDGAWDFGSAVALSADASYAIVGAPLDYSDAGIDAGSARVFSRSGTTWAQQVELIPSTVPLGDPGAHFGAAVAISSDGSRALVGAPYDDFGPTNAGTARVFTLRAPNDGASCTAASECTSGFCVDGVCCASACGDGALDCQACSIAQGGSTDGTCTPLTAAAAPTVVCRASAGECDRDDTCVSTSTFCPINTFLPPTTECRASAGSCDRAERCTGSSATCPSDQVVVFGTTCRAAAGDCDVAEYCDGVGNDCPADVLLTSFTECRASAGACDPAEHCNGTDPVCPTDAIASAGTECRASAGACDVAETCTGSDAACPSDALAGAGVECRGLAGPCDVAEVCTGVDAACPGDVLIAAGIECRAAAGACDVGEACTGVAAACPSDARVGAGTECRAAAGDCDVAETCDGVGTACPSDLLASAGTECRAAAGDCDVAETCDGVRVACPSDAIASAGTECRAAAGDCDVAETCDGVGVACPSDVIASAGVECRAAAGVCDVAESCSGIDAACPSDAFASEGTSCEDSDLCNGHEACASGACAAGTTLDCDDGDACTADACDATSGCSHEPIDACCAVNSDCDDSDACTTDTCTESTCAHDPIAGCGLDGGALDAGVSDAGTFDDAGLTDAATNADGGTAEVAGGCGCAAPGRSRGAASLPLLMIAFFVAARARRRAAR